VLEQDRVARIWMRLVAYMAQTKSGSRNQVSPGARMRCTVTTKLSPVRIDANPEMNTPSATGMTCVVA